MNVLEPLPPPADLREGRAAPPGAALGRGRAALAVLLPAAAAVLALGLHLGLPDRQLLPLDMDWLEALPAWKRPYPLVLAILAAAALVLAAVQAVWRPVRPWLCHHAPLWAGLVVMLAVWDLVTLKLNWLVLPYFPGPDQILGALIEDWEMLLVSTECSLRLLLSGYVMGVAAGLVSGLLIGWSPDVRYWGMPVLKVVGPIPATALVPLVMTIFSGSFLCGAALIGFAVWFPVTMLTASGIANVRLSYLDVARTLGAGRLFLIFRVAVPAALPHIFLGLFMGLGASFLTLIVAETVGVQAGLGYYFKWRQSNMEYAKTYASLIIMALFFSGLMTVLFKVRDRVLAWQKGVLRW